MFIQITAIGRLGKAPEMKFGKSGVAYTRFSVAVNRRWAGKDGEKREETPWLRCTAFNGLAESVNEHVDKGDLIFVQGRLAPDENGNPKLWGDPPRASFDVVVDTCRFLGGTGNGDKVAKSDRPAVGEVPDALAF